MKRIFLIASLLLAVFLTSCVTTTPNCLTPEKYRFQANYNRKGTVPTCLTKECARYQYRVR